MPDGYWDDPLGHPSWTAHPDYSLDIAMPLGEPVLAVHGGKVTYMTAKDSVCGLPGNGNIVEISHLDSVPDASYASGFRKMWIVDHYQHVRHDIPVKIGEWVVHGQVVAYNGCSGAGGPVPGPGHIHFEVNMPGHAGTGKGGISITSIPTPFVEVLTQDGFLVLGDSIVSQNVKATRIERPVPVVPLNQRMRETALFDIHGKRVATGSRPPAGIYFKRLTNGRFKKAVLMP
jgi:murein DD-endopeptidase MepM/ murein hydrolase activator NlpD